jgi:hypothetical protein
VLLRSFWRLTRAKTGNQRAGLPRPASYVEDETLPPRFEKEV